MNTPKRNNLAIELEDKYDSPFTGQAGMKYVVYSQQRTGSNLLCGEMINAGLYGVPGEYFHKMVIDRFTKRLREQGGHDASSKLNFKQYEDWLVSLRTTPNGVFGTKAQPYQIQGITGQDAKSQLQFLSRFDKVIFLSRRNKLKQAVSGAIGAFTKQWRNDGTEPELPNVPDAQLVETISRFLHRYLREELEMRHLLGHLKRPWVEIVYEDYVANKDHTLSEMGTFLGVPYEGNKFDRVELPEKPPGHTAQRLNELFRATVLGEKAA
jgi:LPS sulfotransferase NodH